MLVLSSRQGHHITRPSVTTHMFPETRWTLIERLRRGGDDQERALEMLCRLYWQPLCLYARRLGFAPEDAEDLTQDFLGQGPGPGLFSHADTTRGTMRSYLVTSFQRFAVNEWRRQGSLKRGGHYPHEPLDEFRLEQWKAMTPEEAADQAWAAIVLREVETTLEKDYERRGRADLFRRLRPLVAWYEAGTDDHIARISRESGLNAGAVRGALHRLRAAYRGQIEALLKELVGDEEEARTEARYLLKLWGHEDWQP